MAITDIPLFAMLRSKMQWHQQRQQVLAQNVANADTPNYRARDLRTPSFAELLGRTSSLALATTRPGHLQHSGAATGFRVETDAKTELSPSGNGVVLEDQMLKVSGTANDYALTTNLYKQHLAMLRTVLSRGQ
jgi:flagellar basal-body rod protein FlgB